MIYRYEVTLEVPLGKRQGAMCLRQQGKHLTGTLRLFGHEKPVWGEIESQGHCVLSGQLQTKFHCCDFVAAGSVGGHALQLVLQGDFGTYSMTGVLTENKQEAESR